MRRVDHPRRPLLPWVALMAPSCGVLLAACGGGWNASDGGPAPDPADPSVRPPEAGLAWVETFDHRGQLGALDGLALVDVNRGRLTLPVVPVPVLEGDAERIVGGAEARAGRAHGGDVRIGAAQVITAPDGIELLGARSVRIEGTLRVGAGGLAIVAGESIVITGSVESNGPIDLVVTSPTGEVAIDGEVVARPSTYGGAPPQIEIRGRGALRVRGRVAVEPFSPYGALEPGYLGVFLYGDVRLEGSEASVGVGPGGRAEIRTTGAWVLGSGVTLLDPDGDWHVGARSIEVGERAHVELGGLTAVAEETLALGAGARIQSGGKRLSLTVDTARLGPEARVIGVGGASVRIDAATRLEVAEGVGVSSMTPTCGEGRGLVDVQVAGPFVGLGRSWFRTAASAQGCGLEAGRVPRVTAHRVEGVAPTVGLAGRDVRIDPTLSLVVPPSEARLTGRWRSTPFRLGPGASPRLVTLDADAPSGTTLAVALGVADGPEDEGRDFIPHDPRDPDGWAVHEGADWLVVRVELVGRLHDAPHVDHIVIGP